MSYGMGMVDPCDAALASFDKTYAELGFPLKVIDQGGDYETEITRISTGVAVQPGWFDLPAGYEVMDLGSMMNQNMQGYPAGQGGGMMVPQGDAGDGGVDPEKLQQMMQEMMQQMGRQQ